MKPGKRFPGLHFKGFCLCLLLAQNNDENRTYSRLVVNPDTWNFLAKRQVSLTHPKISRDTWAKHVDASKLDQDSWIQNQIRSDWLAAGQTVLITAGASAPEDVVQDCVCWLQRHFDATVEEDRICEEQVQFSLPSQLARG